MTTKTLKWVKGILANDEYSTDEELYTYFTGSMKLSDEEAHRWIAKRDFYRMNIVMQNDEGNDTGIYDPMTHTVKPLD